VEIRRNSTNLINFESTTITREASYFDEGLHVTNSRANALERDKMSDVCSADASDGLRRVLAPRLEEYAKSSPQDIRKILRHISGVIGTRSNLLSL